LSNSRSVVVIVILIIVITSVLAGLTVANYRFSSQYPGGNDFLSRWVGTRMFLLRGWSPYGEQTSSEIQKMAYGRAARVDEDQMFFVYPLYSVLVVAPVALVDDYALARAIWMTVLEVALVLLCVASINLTRWKLPVWLLALIILFSVLWYHGLRPVINGNLSILVALFVVLAFLALRSEQDAWAGFLLALSTIKPQMVVLLIIFVCIWAISKQRWTVITSFFGSLVILVVASSLFIPDWIIQNIRQVLSYPGYTLPGTPGAILKEFMPGVGNRLGWFITAIVTIILLYEWWAAYGKDFRWFLWTACLTLVITNLIGIRTATENYAILFVVLILIFSYWDERWKPAGRWILLLSMIILFFGLWVLFLKTLQPGPQPIQSSIMFFPLPLFLLIGLYWVRWWATRPPILLIDQIKSSHEVEPG
jgi:Glycosyltransferase family 87